MSEERRGLAGSAAVMFTGTLVSRVLGLLRNIALIGAIGLTGAANSFSVANKLPNVVYMLVAGGVLNAILVPQIVRAMKQRDGGDEYVNRLLTMAGAALLGLTVLLTAGAGVLVTIYASELDPAWFDIAVAFALWCVPQLFFYGMYTLLGQVLNARGNFGPYMWAPALNNVVALVGLIAYIVVFGGRATGAHEDPTAWSGLRIGVIGGTATLGVALQALILIVPLYRSGFRFRPRWGLRGSGLGRASKVATWAFASLLVAQLGFIAISNLAAAAADRGAGFAPGNAAWDNANFLYLLPQSLITVSLVTALFTRVSGYAASGDAAKVRDDLSLGLRTIAVFTVFAGGALAVLAVPLVQAAYLTTTIPEARGIARVLVALLGGIAALGAFTMIQRVYYAFEDTKSLFKLQVPLTALVIVGCLVSMLLPPEWWLVGAAVATTGSNVVGSVVAYLALRLKLPSLDGGRVLRSHLRIVLAATPPLLAGWLLLRVLGPVSTADADIARAAQSLVKVALVGGLMAAGYLLMLRLLKVTELDVILDPALRVLRPVAARVPGLRRWAQVGATPASTMGRDDRDPGPGPDRGSRTLDDDGPGTAPTLDPGTLLSGRYLLDQELTSVLPATALWRGRDEILEREVRALVLPSTTGASAETLDAARRAALVDDPRLERVLDVGAHEGHAFVVTDVAGGPSLAELATSGPMAPEQARAVVGEVASALEAARRRGVHHLVLLPSAVHVTADGQVRLGGLGVAAAYLGVDHDPLSAARTDTVGLVRLLYLALTGTWPEPDDGPRLARQVPAAEVAGGVPVAPSSVHDDVPADLDALCTRSFAGEGPRTPSELIRELAPWRDINVEALTSDHPVWPLAGSLGAGAGVGAAAATAAPSAPLVPAPVEPADEPADEPAPDEAVVEEADVEETGPGPVDETDAVAEPVGDEPVGEGEPDQPSFDDVVADTPDQGRQPLDTTDWQPRPVPSGAGAPEDFTAVVAPEDDDAAASHSARHPRGSVVTAAIGAGVGGAAATVADTTRKGVDSVRRRLSAGAGKVSAAAAARAAEREARAEEELAKTREADVRAALEHGRVPSEPPPVEEQPEPVPAPPQQPAEDRSWESVVTEEPEREPGAPVPFRERRLDPTPIVLAVALVALLIGAIIAFRTLVAEPEDYVAPPAATEEAPVTPEASEPAAEPETTAAPEETTPSEPPAVASLAPLDPEGDGAENPELTPRALDGDDTTYWRSRSYVDPEYGMKTGIGLHVELEEATLVSSVTLDLMGEGGNVEIRATSPNEPTEGDVLASGEMGPDTTFAFDEAVETDSIVLWFTSLPVADSDGRNRIELAELTVG
ncbi:murein biosynthesis integral membrane protein MurJ [Georgenia satyanarayanai]|uniref:Murein biosynthesis integral membrane protein MurJ n=1 Tax=Georgenia satyanarayanai TaxID=860221 RepID=A0A2Y9ASR1_9MICO|nr:murein biosynthesis integral membrane protein MurJ [Georgenia satyanarayanai]PYF96279.1 murein biosynthesis integral membrane protein MurJ [Georgenia satyanarayanai]SSA47115.1 murein biosynthesis integral membrane protein MurJ [Georgenia satyanarayanai]